MDRFINSIGVAAEATSSTVSAQISGIVLPVVAFFVLVWLFGLAALLFGHKPQNEETHDLVTTYRHVTPARQIAPARRITWAPTHRPTMVAAE